MKKIVVNKNDIVNNVKILRDLVEEKCKKTNSKAADIIAVVKANGIGLGLVEYSKILKESGIKYLAVATVEEVKELVDAKLSDDLFMLSPINDKEELEYLIQNDITITIGSKLNFDLAEEICSKLNKKVKAHTKIDVGLGRYGFMYNDFESIKYVYENAKNVEFIGIYTHLVNSEDKKFAYSQFEKYNKVVEFLKENNFEVGIRHVAASRPFVLYDDMMLDSVRFGSIITGRTPFKIEGLKKVGEYVTSVSEIRSIPKGHTISYGSEYKAKKDMRVAIISTGYIDGLGWAKEREVYNLKNNIKDIIKTILKLFKKEKFKVIINNKKYNTVGRFGMFHTVINIENDDIKVNDIVKIEDLHVAHANPNIRREYI